LKKIPKKLPYFFWKKDKRKKRKKKKNCTQGKLTCSTLRTNERSKRKPCDVSLAPYSNLSTKLSTRLSIHRLIGALDETKNTLDDKH
jgi:hypothetical protein